MGDGPNIVSMYMRNSHTKEEPIWFVSRSTLGHITYHSIHMSISFLCMLDIGKSTSGKFWETRFHYIIIVYHNFIRQTCLIRLLLFVIRLCLSSMWYGVASRKDTRSTCLKEIGLCAQNMITIIGLHSQRNLRGGGGRPKWPFKCARDSLFDNEQDIHMSFENYEESGYPGLDWDSLSILY